MKKQSNISDDERCRIKGLIENITKHYDNFENPSGHCFSLSYALSIYFKIKGINCTVSGGKYDNTNIDHFWLSLNEYHDVIIDATIKQFEPSEDSIYIDTKSRNATTKKYDTKIYSINDWLHIYAIWREPIFDEFYLIPRTQEFKEDCVKKIFIAASIIFSEIEQMDDYAKSDFYNTYEYKFYFGAIFKGLRDKWSKEDKMVTYLSVKLPNEFKKLLNRSLI